MGDRKKEPLRGFLDAGFALVIEFLQQAPVLDQEPELLDDLFNDGRDAVGIGCFQGRQREGLVGGNGFGNAPPDKLAEGIAARS